MLEASYQMHQGGMGGDGMGMYGHSYGGSHAPTPSSASSAGIPAQTGRNGQAATNGNFRAFGGQGHVLGA